LSGSEDVNARIVQHAVDRGIAADRIVFAPKMANPSHLARYALADLFLDTAPYGAHTTASDALWMGVPVLTISGKSFASRVCGSLARSAGIPELVCLDTRDYVERAVALAHDRAQLQSLRARLKEGRASCALFDMDGLVARLEGLYAEMCAAHVRGDTPQPDLTNLDRYFEIGLGFDHEAREMLAEPDYQGLYRTELARRHALRPLAADSRLWTQEDIMRADQAPNEETRAPERKRLRG
jgi:hypothetical protein